MTSNSTVIFTEGDAVPHKDEVVRLNPKKLGPWPFETPNLTQTPASLASLEISIREKGIITPLVAWGNSGKALPPTLAGCTRRDIAIKLGIDVPVIFRDFNSAEDAEIFANSDNLERREVSPMDRIKRAYVLWPLFKVAADRKEKSAQGMHPRRRAALAAQVADGQLGEYDFVQRNASDDVKNKLDSGELSIRGAYILTHAELSTAKEKQEETGSGGMPVRVEKVLEDLKLLMNTLKGLPDLSTRIKNMVKSIAGIRPDVRKRTLKKLENAATTIASAEQAAILVTLYEALVDTISGGDPKES